MRAAHMAHVRIAAVSPTARTKASGRQRASARERNTTRPTSDRRPTRAVTTAVTSAASSCCSVSASEKPGNFSTSASTGSPVRNATADTAPSTTKVPSATS